MPIPKFTLRGFRRPREVAAQALGKLEREVLNEIWRRDEVSVRDVYLAFGESVAYTTLMTTLDRLFKKRLLTRRKDGRAFVYLPAVSQEEFEQGIREDVIDGLLGKGAEAVEPLLACIVDTVSERDRELLDELDFGRVADPQDRSYFRIFLDERAELLRQQVLAGNIAATDPEFAAERAVKLFYGGQCLSFKRKETARFDRDHLAQRSQTNLTRSSVK